MRKLKSILLTLAATIMLSLPLAPTLVSTAYADTASSNDACEALKDLNPDGKGCGAADSGVDKIVRLALQFLSIVAGIIAVIMIIVSGFKYVTSQGDPNSISSAKQALIYAIAGLVVVAFAQAIVMFALRRSINA